jgi:membrane protease YdiL (CAAX protease family)
MLNPMVASMLLVVGVLGALGGWALLFRRPAEGVWTRTWLVAALLSAYAVVALAVTDRLHTALGPVDAGVVAVGLAVGSVWLGATHVGHAVLCRLVPGFLAQISDLYSMREGDRVGVLVAPVVLMAAAEELFFRGLVQDHVGLAGAVVIYAGVQLVTGKWALTLAAALGGTVWGLLLWWTGGLLAPVLAHVLWTATLAFVWPLGGCGPDRGGADEAPLAAGTADRTPAVPAARVPDEGAGERAADAAAVGDSAGG